MLDPYEVLGIARAAGRAEVKAAYRALAKRSHPDRNAGDPEAARRFSDIQAAYRIVGDDDRRRAFDNGEIDAEGRRRRPAAKPRAGAADNAAMMYRIFGDVAGRIEVEGAPGIDAVPEPPPDEEASSSGTRNEEDEKAHPLLKAIAALARFVRPIRARPRREIELAVPVDILVAGGEMDIDLPGMGQRVLRVPPLTAPGSLLELEDNADELVSAIRVTAAADPRFETDGVDLTVLLKIALHDAVLGTRAEVEAPEGPVPAVVPPWSDGDRPLIVAGHGLPRAEGGRGDLVVRLCVLLPHDLDDALVDLMRERAAATP